MEQTIEKTSDLILPTSRDSQFKTMTLEPGMTLVQSGQPLLGLITVVKGRLKRKRHYPAGEFLVGIAGAGERIGMIELLASMRRVDALPRGNFGPQESEGLEVHHLETLEAIGHVEVQIESATVVEMRLRALPQEIRRALLDLANGQGELVTKGVGDLGISLNRLRRPLDLMPVKARVAATLWQLMEAHGVRVADGVLLDLDLTREEIAHLAGTVYESVIRMLTKFKNDGLIQLDGRKILIKDETLLARTAQVVLDRPESPLASSQFHTGVERHDSRSDKEAVIENHSSKNNGRSKEAS